MQEHFRFIYPNNTLIFYTRSHSSIYSAKIQDEGGLLLPEIEQHNYTSTKINKKKKQKRGYIILNRFTKQCT